MRQQLSFKVKLLSQRGEEEKSQPLLLALQTGILNVVSKITHTYTRVHAVNHRPQMNLEPYTFAQWPSFQTHSSLLFQ